MVIALSLVIGVGYYVFNASRSDKKPLNQVSQTPVSQSKTKSPNKLVSYQFAQEKLKLDYDNEYWKVSDSQSGKIECQEGQVNQDSLALAHSDFNLSFRFGQCGGKGGGICFEDPDSGCTRESRNLGEVTVAGNKTWYILASRATIDSGKTWRYELWLNDEPICKTDLCHVPATNIQDDMSSIFGSYTDKSNITSLDQFSDLPEVKAAVTLLKTAKY